MGKYPKIVVIGGGTGSFTLLQALKHWSPNIIALVNMADNGGSSGILRDELGVLPPGDIRQCLVALSDAPLALRNLFSYRFPEESTFSGHSFGNLFLSAVEKMTDDFGQAIVLASQVLHITGRVLPVTLTNCHLTLQVGDMCMRGEYEISIAKFNRRDKPLLALEPQAVLNPDAYDALTEADLIVIAPGNLYGSLIPALLPDGMKRALATSNAVKAYVCNLVNKSTQTADFYVHDYIESLEQYMGPVLNAVLYNIDEPAPKTLQSYANHGEHPVLLSTATQVRDGLQLIPGDFLCHENITADPNDRFIARSLIRHDATSITLALKTLIS
ncbi:MAG: hypothetical protein NVS1B7_5810 [Candidatus Saccharimonadales bacterium]